MRDKITLRIDAYVLEKAKLIAAKKGESISEVTRTFLKSYGTKYDVKIMEFNSLNDGLNHAGRRYYRK